MFNDPKTIAKLSVLTTREVAEKLGVTRQRIASLVKEGELEPFKKTNETSLFLAADVEEYIERKNRGTAISYVRVTPPFLYCQESSTRRNLSFFDENKHLFNYKNIVSVNAYFDRVDAAADNYFMPSSGKRYGNLIRLDIPHLIIKDNQDREIWFNGCNCGYGGEGPRGTISILKTCGFSDEVESIVKRHRVVKLLRGDNGEIEDFSRDSLFSERGGAPYEGNAHLYYHDGRLTLIQDESFLNDSLTTLERYFSFIPNPSECIIIPSYEKARELGYTAPGDFMENAYRLIIRDVSGRQIWLNPQFDEEKPLHKQPELNELLEACGLDIPNNYKRTAWINTILRRVPAEPIRITR